MKVRQLIRELKKMPQYLEVGMATHDNSEGEIAGWVNRVWETEEVDMDTGKKTGRTVVVLRD